MVGVNRKQSGPDDHRISEQRTLRLSARPHTSCETESHVRYFYPHACMHHRRSQIIACKCPTFVQSVGQGEFVYLEPNPTLHQACVHFQGLHHDPLPDSPPLGYFVLVPCRCSQRPSATRYPPSIIVPTSLYAF